MTHYWENLGKLELTGWTSIISGVHLLVKPPNELEGQGQGPLCTTWALSTPWYITAMELATPDCSCSEKHYPQTWAAEPTLPVKSVQVPISATNSQVVFNYLNN